MDIFGQDGGSRVRTTQPVRPLVQLAHLLELLQVMLVTKNVMLEFVVIVLYKSKALSEGYNNKSGTIIKIVFSPQQIIHKNTTQ